MQTQKNKAGGKLLHDIGMKRDKNLCSNGGKSHEENIPMRNVRKCEDGKVEDMSSKNDRSGMDEDEYEVERILKRQPGDGSREVEKYLVLWKGYSREEATWEPKENLIKCEEVVADFECQLESLEST